MFEKYRIRDDRVSLTNIDYMGYEQQRKLIENIAKPSYKSVLDFGAGNSPYEYLFKADKYVKADVSQNLNKTIDVVLEKNEIKLPFDSGEFELILCMDVLEHVKQDREILQELKRVLAKNGKLIISLPFMYREHEYPNDFRRYTSAGIYELLKQTGFENVEVSKLGNSWYVLYSIWTTRLHLNGEIDGRSFFNKAIRKILRLTLLPILNLSVFRKLPAQNEGIFLKLFVVCQ